MFKTNADIQKTVLGYEILNLLQMNAKQQSRKEKPTLYVH